MKKICIHLQNEKNIYTSVLDDEDWSWSNYFCFQKLTRCKVEYKCILLKANINLRKKALLVEHWYSLEIVKLEYVNDWMVHFPDKASRMKKNIYIYMYVCIYVSGP